MPTTCVAARSPSRSATVARPAAPSPASIPTATSRSSRSTRPARAPSTGGPATGSRSARRCSASPHRSAAACGSRSGSSRPCRARSAGRAVGGSPGSVEHTAPLAPGSSGGAIVDAAGKFVGLNTNRIGEGFYLALPADAALRARVDALGRGESAKRLRLGVAIAPSHVARRLRRSVGLPERAGILVRGVEEGSLAESAGVEAGDLIVSAGGKPIGDADDLFDALGGLEPPFELAIVRGAEERTVTRGRAGGRWREDGAHARRRVRRAAGRHPGRHHFWRRRRNDTRLRRRSMPGRALASRPWNASSAGTASPRRPGPSSR